MEHEIKVKADDRWMDDSEASHCLGCHAEFTFLLRKVCFVKNCSNSKATHARTLSLYCLRSHHFFSLRKDKFHTQEIKETASDVLYM